MKWKRNHWIWRSGRSGRIRYTSSIGELIVRTDARPCPQQRQQKTKALPAAIQDIQSAQLQNAAALQEWSHSPVRQSTRELAKPLRKEIARWGDGGSTRYSPVPGPPSTGPPHRRPTEQLRNRGLPTGAQILPTARTKYFRREVRKVPVLLGKMVSAEGLEPSTP
jgi:hypothetical protein